MTNLSAKDMDRIFVAPDTPSFEDLMVQVKADTTLSKTRCRDLLSGLRGVAKALKRMPAQVPADPRWLQPRLARIEPAALNLAPKTWQNTVSNAHNAMAACGIVSKRHRRVSDLSDDWHALWEDIRASKDKSLLSSLPRFVHFLNRLDVAPEEVSDAHADLYFEAVRVNEISKNPENAHVDAIMGWNRAVDRVATWPRQRLTRPSRGTRVMLPEGEYPQSFIEDLDSYLAARVDPDPLGDGPDLRRLTSSSATTYRYMLLRFTSHVVQSGVPAKEIMSLADLLQPDRVKLGLLSMWASNGEETSRVIGKTAGLLLTVAGHLDLPEDTRAQLKHFSDRFQLPDNRSLTPKNRERLRALTVPETQARLLALPEQIMARPLGVHRVRALRAREEAIAIAILLYCPLRISNIASIEIERHLQRPGNGTAYLVFPAHEVKNNTPMEFELPASLVEMIDTHLATRSPEICKADCPYLFPAMRKAHASTGNSLSERLKKRALKEIGVPMNAHLFRHFAVYQLLNAHPGAYEVARQLLGHSALSHTLSVYRGLETASATKVFAEVVDDLKKGTS
ncbi:site-specific integrase [Roseovarius aestuariivivens]|uniref:site-specific integrase n=1 Tax=Roseovarius aestuariivivens TaxID=1888910 RepID=UPI001436898C|nr:site-specific integrase [Roseovarius aestuariivivens]